MTFPGNLLSRWQLFPKKYMGQNFLVDPSTAEMIVRRAALDPDAVVVEIGAGLGALTVCLARRARVVYAVEKDRDLIEILDHVRRENQLVNILLINRNIFDVDPGEIARRENGPLILFGNLPYNISSQVVIWAVANRHVIQRAVFMFQKEVAQRIRASAASDNYSRLSVMVQYAGRVARVAKVDAHQFHPRPKVDSEVIEIRFDPGMLPRASDERVFAAVVAAAFGRRRKTLKNALSGNRLGIDERVVACMWETTAIDPRRRAETLAVEEFVELSNALVACTGNLP